MAASFVGAWTDFHSDNAGGLPVVITPTAETIQPGDLLLFFALTRNSFPGPSPSGLGWIKRAEYDVNNSSIDTDLNQDDRFVLWSKVAGENEPASYALEITDNGTDGSLGHLVAFRGASFGNVGAAAGVTAPSVAGTEDGALVCFFGFAFDTNGSYTAVPSGMTLAAQEAAHNDEFPTGISAYELLTTSGATGTRAVGHSNVNTFSIAVSVALDPGSPPVVTITEPSDNDSFENGEEITFVATALDAEDGDISDDVVWTSDIDGEIGTGATVATDALTHNKRHKITATVEDSDDQVGFDTIEITVGTPPTQWATDFEEYTPNEAPPDWSFQFGGASVFQIRDDATYGRHLRAENIAADRTVYVWDEVGVARGHVQAFAILRRLVVDFAGVAVAVGGSSGSETCYAVLIGQTVDGGTKIRSRIRRYENGASAGDLVIFDAPHVGVSGYPYAILIDYDPDTGIVLGKVWQPADLDNPGADEPDWGLQYVDSSPLPAGRVGVFGSASLLTDYFSAGAEGFPAPLELGGDEENVPATELEVETPTPLIIAGSAVEVPLTNLEVETLIPSLSGGDAVDVPATELEVETLAPEVLSGATVSVPLSELEFETLTLEVLGGATVSIPFSEFEVETLVPEVLSGVTVSVPATELEVDVLTPTVETTHGIVIEVPVVDLILEALLPLISTTGTGEQITVLYYNIYRQSFFDEEIEDPTPLVPIALEVEELEAFWDTTVSDSGVYRFILEAVLSNGVILTSMTDWMEIEANPWVDKPIPLCQGPWVNKEIPEPGEPWLARIAATGDWTLR